MSRIRAIAVAAGLALAGSTSSALAAAGIEGVWKLVDDKTGRVTSLVRVDVKNGEAGATIVDGVAAPGETLDPDERCVKCPPPFKDQKLIGLQFLWGLKGSGNEWRDGQILDPREGKIYRAKATLSADGKTLSVRGFIGVSLFGRSQEWLRDESGVGGAK